MAIITISRGTFSGGQSLAECVSSKLNYRCISREILTKAAKDYGIEEELLRKAVETKPGRLERIAASKTIVEKPEVLQTIAVERVHYLTFIRAALINEIRNDNVVYHGNAGHFLLRDVPHILKIRVIANMEFRINAAMTRNHLDREEAIRYIKKMDEERASWTQFLYHVDWRDPELYDIVINIDRMSLDSACKLVSDAALLDEFRAPPDWEKIWQDLNQSSSIRVALALDKQIGKIDRGIEIEANAGVIVIKGEIDSPEDAEKIQQMVRKLPGVKDVVFGNLALSHH